MCSAQGQSRICPPALTRDGMEVLAQGSGCGWLSDSSAPGHAGRAALMLTAAALGVVVSESCLETFGLDMNKLGYTGQNSLARDVIAVPWECLGRELREPQQAISYSQMIARPSAEEASSPERRALRARTATRESETQRQNFFLHSVFLLPFAGSQDPTQILPCLLCPNSIKHVVTTEDQAHTARSFPTLHKNSPTMKHQQGFSP